MLGIPRVWGSHWGVGDAHDRAKGGVQGCEGIHGQLEGEGISWVRVSSQGILGRS